MDASDYARSFLPTRMKPLHYFATRGRRIGVPGSNGIVSEAGAGTHTDWIHSSAPSAAWGASTMVLAQPDAEPSRAGFLRQADNRLWDMRDQIWHGCRQLGDNPRSHSHAADRAIVLLWLTCLGGQPRANRDTTGGPGPTVAAMVQTFVSVSTTLGVLLLILGLSLSLVTPPTALIITGLVMAFAGAAVRWYSAIVPEVPPTATEAP